MTIWRFPKIREKIWKHHHFVLGFSMINHPAIGVPTYGKPSFVFHLTSASCKRRETIHLSALAGLWRAVSSPRIPKQAAFTPSGLQGERQKKQPNTPDIASKNMKLKNPNDNLRVFWRDQTLGFDFYACMESAWTTVLASHKGLRASAPHNLLPSLDLDTRKAHLSKCGPTKLSQCMLVLCRGRFAWYVSSKALKMWRLHSWCFGPWSLLSKGDFGKTHLLGLHLHLPGRAMRRSFSPGHGKNWTHEYGCDQKVLN